MFHCLPMTHYSLIGSGHYEIEWAENTAQSISVKGIASSRQSGAAAWHADLFGRAGVV